MTTRSRVGGLGGILELTKSLSLWPEDDFRREERCQKVLPFPPKGGWVSLALLQLEPYVRRHDITPSKSSGCRSVFLAPYLPQPQIFRETAAFLHLHSCRHKYANNAIVNVKCVRLCVNYLSIDVGCRISRDGHSSTCDVMNVRVEVEIERCGGIDKGDHETIY